MGNSGPEVRGSLHPDEFLVQKDHTIAFAVTHPTIRPDETPVNESASFRVQPNGKVTLRSIFLNAASYEVLRKVETGKAIKYTYLRKIGQALGL